MPSPIHLAARVIDKDHLPPGWVIDRDGVARPFWYSYTGYIVKWSLFLGIFGSLFLFFLIGTCHARARLRKGKMPLKYHRFMVARAELARIDPKYAAPTPMYYPYPAQPYGAQPPPGYYGMQTMAPPPPVYQPGGPVGGKEQNEYAGNYAPPSGFTSVPAPRPSGEFAPPPGPPPTAQRI